jgi:hypothetical protein
MAFSKIQSEADLKKYIKRKLGDGIISVELTESQLSDCINEAINKFTTFAYEGYTEDVYLLPVQQGVRKYKLPDKTLALLNIYVGNASMFTMPDRTVIQSDFVFQMFGFNPQGQSYQIDITQVYSMMAQYEHIMRFFRKCPNYSWNSFNKEINFLEDVYSQGYPNILLHLALQYTPGEIDDIYNHTWVKNYAHNLALLQQGTNLGKYDASLVSGSKIEYNRMISDAKEALSKLDEDLTKLYGCPTGITVV